MFWDKKDSKKSLPDLPPLKTPMRPGFDLPEIEDKTDGQPLTFPSFPESPLQKGFSNTPIKENLNNGSEKHHEEPISEEAKKIRTMEMEEWNPQNTSSVLDEPPEQPLINRVSEKRIDRKSPSTEVFVKIEKFNSARRALDSINQKLDDMDILLKKVRDTKMREEQELSGWEKELTAIKGRIQDINSNIFE